MHVSCTLVFHQSKCISAVRRILSIVAAYVRSNFFMNLCVPCYCDACLKSSTLCAGMKMLHQQDVTANMSIAIDRAIAESKLVDSA